MCKRSNCYIFERTFFVTHLFQILSKGINIYILNIEFTIMSVFVSENAFYSQKNT